MYEGLKQTREKKRKNGCSCCSHGGTCVSSLETGQVPTQGDAAMVKLSSTRRASRRLCTVLCGRWWTPQRDMPYFFRHPRYAASLVSPVDNEACFDLLTVTIGVLCVESNCSDFLVFYLSQRRYNGTVHRTWSRTKHGQSLTWSRRIHRVQDRACRFLCGSRLAAAGDENCVELK